MYKVKMRLLILIILIYNLFMTFPSVMYHGIIKLHRRLTSKALIKDVLEGEKVVICIHGRGGHYTDLEPLIRNLKELIPEKGYRYRMVDLGNTRNTSIDTDVAVLKRELENYIGCEITFIGLSKGGLIAMRYITTIMDPRIKRAITISSPLRGTKAANLLSKESITNKELGYNSEITRDIAGTNIHIPVYHVVPSWDYLIIPTESAAYTNTNNENIYHYRGLYSHSGIVHSKDMANAISCWL